MQICFVSHVVHPSSRTHHSGRPGNMRLSIIGLLASVAICPAYSYSGGCPYAGSLDPMPHAHSARGLPATGKEGVMLMNRIGP